MTESDSPNLRIRFLSGIGFLREDYKNKGETKYYLVLGGRLLAEGVDRFPAPELKEIAIPLSIEQYTALHLQLQDNRAQSPVIRIKGSLDVTVDVESFA